MLLTIALLFLRMDTVRSKVKMLSAEKSTTENESLLSLNSLIHSTMKRASLGVVSVREKVIEELRSV